MLVFLLTIVAFSVVELSRSEQYPLARTILRGKYLKLVWNGLFPRLRKFKSDAVNMLVSCRKIRLLYVVTCVYVALAFFEGAVGKGRVFFLAISGARINLSS